MLNRLITMAAVAAGGYYVAKQLKKNKSASGDSSVREAITVNVPVRTAYDQWTQFEQFPEFMDSVHEVRQLDDKRLHWKADVLGKPVEWDAEITEQIPDQRIAWRSTTGKLNNGVVTFDQLSGDRCRITLTMTYQPEGTLETIGDALGAVRLEASGNLKRFKEMMEKRGKETGAWRGTIQEQGQGVGQGQSQGQGQGQGQSHTQSQSHTQGQGQNQGQSQGNGQGLSQGKTPGQGLGQGPSPAAH